VGCDKVTIFIYLERSGRLCQVGFSDKSVTILILSDQL